MYANGNVYNYSKYCYTLSINHIKITFLKIKCSCINNNSTYNKTISNIIFNNNFRHVILSLILICVVHNTDTLQISNKLQSNRE